jgi:hypothetical protein
MRQFSWNFKIYLFEKATVSISLPSFPTTNCVHTNMVVGFRRTALEATIDTEKAEILSLSLNTPPGVRHRT